MKGTTVYHRLAEIWIGDGMSEATLLHYAECRRGRSWEDVSQALYRGLRRGQGKTEVELVTIAGELQKVVKPRRDSVASGTG